MKKQKSTLTIHLYCVLHFQFRRAYYYILFHIMLMQPTLQAHFPLN
jgi:hypothetical protein